MGGVAVGKKNDGQKTNTKRKPGRKGHGRISVYDTTLLCVNGVSRTGNKTMGSTVGKSQVRSPRVHNASATGAGQGRRGREKYTTFV